MIGETPHLVIFWAMLPLLGILLVGAAAVYLADRYRKRAAADSCRTEDQLTNFRALYDRGALTKEEYDRIRGRLNPRLKHPELAPDPPTPLPPSAPSEAGPPTPSG
jgi:hypothetical protein